MKETTITEKVRDEFYSLYWQEKRKNTELTAALENEKREYAELYQSTAEYERELTAENNRLKSLLESLTPGGSEYSGSPDNCARWVKERLSSIVAQVKRRKEVEAENQQLKNLLAEWVAPYDGMDADKFAPNVAAQIKATRQLFEDAE